MNNMPHSFTKYALFSITTLLIIFSSIYFCTLTSDFNKKKAIYNLLNKEDYFLLENDTTYFQNDSIYLPIDYYLHIPADSLQMPIQVYNDSVKIHIDSVSLIIQYDGLEKNDNIPVTLTELHNRLSLIENKCNYITKKFANTQFEIDLMIDKSSQWVGFWLSIIGIVLTITTILQVYANYRSNSENKETIKKITRDIELSTKSNKISCITSCLSSLPELFYFTPEDKRKKFSQKFINILYNEYTEYIVCVSNIIQLEDLMSSNLKKELDYVYLSWCQIIQAINNTIYDSKDVETNIEYHILKESLNSCIDDYHKNNINSKNIIHKMTEIQEHLDNFRQGLSS